MEDKTTTVSSNKTYLEMFKENYRGASPEGKELIEFLKKRESGRATVDYIPWAVLVRMAKIQDPDFMLEKIRNEDGTFLFYNGREGMDDACYFVRVSATFLGKTHIEDYPVQDFNFEPASFNGRTMTLSSGRIKEIKLDANIINKALQRATAKAISQITGLGLSLYENGDLQFEEDAPVIPASITPHTPVMPKKISKPTITPTDTSVPTAGPTPTLVAEPTVENAGLPDDIIRQLKELQSSNEDTKNRLIKAMKAYNVSKIEDFTLAQAERIIQVLNKSLGGNRQ